MHMRRWCSVVQCSAVKYSGVVVLTVCRSLLSVWLSGELKGQSCDLLILFVTKSWVGDRDGVGVDLGLVRHI